MGIVAGLVCVRCDRHFKEGETETTCPECGLEGILDVLYDYDAIDGEKLKRHLAGNHLTSLWRYQAVLPVHDTAKFPTVPVGWSPLFRSERLEGELGLSTLWIKDDGRNPSASLKDRASAVAVARAAMLGRDSVACASTGNAATSLAGMAAHMGMNSFIFVPANAPVAKRTQLLVYGATVFLVEGSYTDAFQVATEALDHFGWYNRNCAINPYLVEGKKTVSWEIAEQSGWNPPEILFASIGDGCTISGIFKGFAECHRLGLIDHIPRIIGVQAEGASPIYTAWKNKAPLIPQEANTIADSIAVGFPRNHRKALNAVEGSSGEIITVTDDDILEAMAILARNAGVFGEPAGVAGFAGLLSSIRRGTVERSSSMGIIVTGNGLKDIAAASRLTGRIISISPDFDDVRKALS